MPPFDSNGPALGVQSPYIASMVELATELGTTAPRIELIRNLLRYRLLLAGEGYFSGFQLIDGSFVENVEVLQNRPPRDIDVVSFLDKPQKYANDQPAWNTAGIAFWSAEVVDVRRNKARFLLDTYALLNEDVQVGDIMYWHGLFSHQRITYSWKGYLWVPLDPNDDAIALNQLGGP